jgi:hypothetical protein
MAVVENQPSPVLTFIRDHHEEITVAFAAFAKTLMPPGAEISAAELRDHAEDLLTAIVQDLGLAQNSREQSRKRGARVPLSQ